MEENKLLHRQVHPAFIQGNSLSSQAFSFTSQVFTPTHKDKGFLSVYNGKIFNAEEAYNHYTTNPSFESGGVVSVSASECEELSLKIYEDNNPFFGHNSIDFNDFNQSQIISLAKKLKAKAILRGWQYIK